MKDRFLKLIKSKELYRYVLSLLFIFSMLFHGIDYMNAGASYEQAVAFRPFCIDFGMLILVNMDYKLWHIIPFALYAPVCYLTTHYLYLNHIIPDICEYQFEDVIRYGKLVALVWGYVIIFTILYVIKKKLWKKLNRFNPILGILWLAYVVLILLFKREYYYTLIFVIGFTSLYIILSDVKKQKALLLALQDAVIIVFLYIVYKSLRHRPYDCERYALYFSNSNMAGTFLSLCVITIFCKLDYWWKNNSVKWLKIVMLIAFYLLMGVAVCLSIFNYTRTMLIALGFAFLTLFIVELVKSEKKRSVIAKYALVIVAMIVLFRATFLAIRYIPAYNDAPVFFMGEENPETRVIKGDAIDSPKYTSMESFLTLALGKWGIYIYFEDGDKTKSSEVDSLSKVEYHEDKDVSNGRGDIWREYGKRLNATGHFPGHIYLEDDTLIYHAHNSYLFIMYQYGVIAGIVYIVLMVSAYVIGILKYKAKSDAMHLFALLMIATCLAAQVTEWIGHVCYGFYSVTFIALGFLICQGKTKKQGEMRILK